MQFRLAGVLLLCTLFPAFSAIAQKVAQIPPPPKVELKPEERAELDKGVQDLGQAVESLRRDLAGKPELLARMPDVQIYYNAVRYPLTYHEQIDVKAGREAIRDGLERAAQLRDGKPGWINSTGPRGYVSKIDESVQPYILMVPASYKSGDAKKYRLDFVEHGRNEGLTELNMIRTKGDHAVGGAMEKFVVLLYGRYCNANKFAGEIDLLEAFDDVKKHFPIDEDRILNIGFSMGGASAWQFATHYSDLFAAASPGAGFSETREFLRLSPKDIEATPWYEKKLWHLYDCTDWCVNLSNLPTVAYSGELDGQKQSADIMEKCMAAERLKLERIIGPNTKHAYEKGAKAELDKRLDELLANGRDFYAPHVRFATYTLRYNRMKWVTILAMEKEWGRADVDAEVKGNKIVVTTHNVSRLQMSIPAGPPLFEPGRIGLLTIDGQSPPSFTEGTDGKWSAVLEKTGTKWDRFSLIDYEAVRKRHGLQGPIDDAFMDRFIIVRPTGTPLNSKVGAWAQAECSHAIDHWRKQFRGEALVKDDTDVTEDDIRTSNLILFGDPRSNKLIARVLAARPNEIQGKALPTKWTDQEVVVGPKPVSSANHVLVMIYPNPLNQHKYVVLNSGFTFREYDYLNNAREIPKLPDYAVIDIDIPATPRSPGGVVDAGFFGEKWELLADEGR